MSKSNSTTEEEKGPYDTVEAKPEGKDDVKLEAKMTLINGITIIVGSIIGSGIFVAPSGVIKHCGSVNSSLIVWAASGIFSMIGAYCYAELGCMIKKSGADYAYIMTTFGPCLAFVRLWVECMIVRPCSQAIVALTFSLYTLTPFFPTCAPPEEAKQLLALCCICLLTFVNCWSVKWATKVQDFFTYAKVFALLVIIAAGMYQLMKGRTENFTFENSNLAVTSIALSFYQGLFAFNGWNYLNFIIEELKDPVRNLPIAIYVSCSLVTFIYLFTNVAFYTTLTPNEVLVSDAVAVSFANKLFGWMAWTIPVFVALSTFGAVNGILLTSSRLFYAGACEGQLPEILTMIQVSRKTPTPAVLTMALLSMMYLFNSNIEKLITYVGFATWLSIGVSVFCVPWLRYTQPNLPRPLKVNLIFPFAYVLLTLMIVLPSTYEQPIETGYGILMILSALPVYFIFIARKTKSKYFKGDSVDFTKFLQKIMMVVGKSKPAQV